MPHNNFEKSKILGLIDFRAYSSLITTNDQIHNIDVLLFIRVFVKFFNCHHELVNCGRRFIEFPKA